jgi:hypothetical protein
VKQLFVKKIIIPANTIIVNKNYNPCKNPSPQNYESFTSLSQHEEEGDTLEDYIDGDIIDAVKASLNKGIFTNLSLKELLNLKNNKSIKTNTDILDSFKRYFPYVMKTYEEDEFEMVGFVRDICESAELFEEDYPELVGIASYLDIYLSKLIKDGCRKI